jgi:predicted transcriptional regulator
MSVQVQINAEFPEELEAQLRSLAQDTGRSTGEIVVEAVRSYIDYETEFREAVEEGLRAAEAGDLVDHEEVVAQFEKRFGPRR